MPTYRNPVNEWAGRSGAALFQEDPFPGGRRKSPCCWTPLNRSWVPEVPQPSRRADEGRNQMAGGGRADPRTESCWVSQLDGPGFGRLTLWDSESVLMVQATQVGPSVTGTKERLGWLYDPYHMSGGGTRHLSSCVWLFTVPKKINKRSHCKRELSFQRHHLAHLTSQTPGCSNRAKQPLDQA